MANKYYWAAIHRDRGPSAWPKDNRWTRAEQRAVVKVIKPVAEGYLWVAIAIGLILFVGVILALTGLTELGALTKKKQGTVRQRLEASMREMDSGNRQSQLYFWSIPFGPMATALLFAFGGHFLPILFALVWMLASLLAMAIIPTKRQVRSSRAPKGACGLAHPDQEGRFCVRPFGHAGNHG